LVYLDAGDDIDGALGRVGELGGTALSPVIDLGDQGRMALLLDTEGNRIALHAS
jgi:predicted enzyme related to lactoylglutathione lyase